MVGNRGKYEIDGNIEKQRKKKGIIGKQAEVGKST